MTRSWKVEAVARLLVFVIVVVLPIATFASPFGHQHARGMQEVVLIGRVVEHGGWSPDRIVVKKGQRVRLVVWSYDVTHRLVIPGLVDTGPVTGGSSRIVEFVAAEEGRFPFRCTVYCSPEHAYLQGELIVEL